MIWAFTPAWRKARCRLKMFSPYRVSPLPVLQPDSTANSTPDKFIDSISSAVRMPSSVPNCCRFSQVWLAPVNISPVCNKGSLCLLSPPTWRMSFRTLGWYMIRKLCVAICMTDDSNGCPDNFLNAVSVASLPVYLWIFHWLERIFSIHLTSSTVPCRYWKPCSVAKWDGW